MTKKKQVKQNDNKILICIPSYNRGDMLDKMLKKYSKYNLDVLVFGQGYSDTFIKKHDSTAINFINFNKPMGIGYIRQNMLEYVFKKLKTQYEYIVMHDDDLILEKNDMFALADILNECPRLNVSTIDIYGLCNELDYIVSDVVFSIACFRCSKLKDIYKHLSVDINANEDAELMYLLGNQGILINKRFFETSIDEPAIHSNSVIPHRSDEFIRSANKLVKKYGKQMKISYTEKSKNMITKFQTFQPTIIYFEGVDKSGKSTLIQEFNKISNFEFYTSDRSPISTIAYSRLFDRQINENVLFKYLNLNKANILFVYTHCSPGKIKERIKDTNHEEIEIEDNIACFDELINELSEKEFNVIKINTNQTDAKTNAEKLFNRIKAGDLSDEI